MFKLFERNEEGSNELVEARKEMSRVEKLNEVLDYIKEHDGEELDYDDMVMNVEGVGNTNTLYSLMKDLRDRGSIEKQGGHFSRTYVVKRSRVNDTSNRRTKEVAEVKPVEKEAVTQTADELVLEFMKQERSTNIFDFIDWIDNN